MSPPEPDHFAATTTLDDLDANSPQSVQVDGKSIGLFQNEGEVFAIDTRCPHMGFPLTDGTVDDGILTCPWHHARFELSCGDTFDPFADDVGTYPTEVRDGVIYVNPNTELDKPPIEHWKDRLEHGLQENIDLVIAKAVLGLADEGIAESVPVEIGTAFGTHYRQDGWGSGLTTVGVMANLLDDLRPEDRSRALYTGLTAVADHCAGEPPFFAQDALSTVDVPTARLQAWFRDNIEVRDADGAERVIRAAVQNNCDRAAVVGMFAAAATDHLYLDTGHRLDFINKAFVTLDHIGWEYADDVLPSLVPSLAIADRAEEQASWRQPIDIAQLCFDAAEDLPSLVAEGEDDSWTEPEDFVDNLLSDDPHASMDSLTTAIANGATTDQLARRVADATAHRVAHFGTSNEFRDWNTVHHTYSYMNAVHGVCQRTDARALYRGIFAGAMKIYLDRFLNVPPAPLPEPTGQGDPDAIVDELVEKFEIEADDAVKEAGTLTTEYLAAGGNVDRLKRTLGQVLLREDAGFHPRQNLEAAFTQYDAAEDEARSRIHLIATARYLAAHTPTRRASEQTFCIAARLNRGEKIHES